MPTPSCNEHSRKRFLTALRDETFDVLILGGGINGAGTLRDLALRAKVAGTPLKLALVEKNHFASGTSGKNSQLIHGGLRYLEYFEFSLVREALRERATLLEIAPHLVEPQALLLPTYGWFDTILYQTGLWMYDWFAGARNIERHRNVPLKRLVELLPGIETKGLTAAARFYDARSHSARLVLENIFEAAGNGAVAANYCEAVSKEKEGDAWRVRLRDSLTGDSFETRARQLVDATGAWSTESHPRLVRGSHLILPQLFPGEEAISYFDTQGRIIFFIPWGTHRNLTLVGTTDADHTAGADKVAISDDETRYLLSIVARVFPKHSRVTPIATYASLRPLLPSGGSATSASREHRIWRAEDGIVHISGGKYTTYRSMSEEASDLIAGRAAPALSEVHVTASTPVAGNSQDAVRAMLARHPRAMVNHYGVLSAEFERTISPEVLPGLDAFESAQFRWARRHELAQKLSDFLYVSTYLGYERPWAAETLAALEAEFRKPVPTAG
ncbi:MAG: glycerol-3-phosphate dehydrogenase/oxidase [Bryobacteraceae bacterium]